jgi:putative addiction module killer protein
MIEIKQTATFMTWESKLKDQRAKAAIAARIFRLANGLPGDVSPVGQGVSELRIHYGPGYRVYFQQRGDGNRHPAMWWRQGQPVQGYRNGETPGK